VGRDRLKGGTITKAGRPALDVVYLKERGCASARNQCKIRLLRYDPIAIASNF
jgi:hypothetical protein